MSTAWLILLVLAALLGGVVLFASRQPNTFRIERRAVIRAAPQVIFDQINDLVAWQGWSPWAKKDPNAKMTFGPTIAGSGAWCTWDGDRNVGKGRMTILASHPHDHVHFRLDFEAPFKATNIAEFTLVARGESTEVVWAMHGTSNLMSKVMCLFMDMDKMVGTDFEKGLASLTSICET